MTQKYCKYVVKSKRKCCSATKDKNENDPEKCEISLKSNRCVVKKTKTGLKKTAPKDSVKKEPVAKESVKKEPVSKESVKKEPVTKESVAKEDATWHTESQKSIGKSVESLDKVYKRYIKNDMSDNMKYDAYIKNRMKMKDSQKKFTNTLEFNRHLLNKNIKEDIIAIF